MEESVDEGGGKLLVRVRVAASARAAPPSLGAELYPMRVLMLVIVLCLARTHARRARPPPPPPFSDDDAATPTLFTGGDPNAAKCMPFCRDTPCTGLNGNTEDECSGCPSSHKCRPGVPGYGFDARGTRTLPGGGSAHRSDRRRASQPSAPPPLGAPPPRPSRKRRSRDEL